MAGAPAGKLSAKIIMDENHDTDGLPAKLGDAIDAGQACVYVAISDSRALAGEVR
jgi:hypothetical protein